MIAAALILTLFFSLLLAMLYDIDCALEDAQNELLLDELWDDDTSEAAA